MPELLSIEEFEYRTMLGSTSDAFVVGIGHVQFLPKMMLTPGIDMGTHPFGLPLPHYNSTYLHPKSEMRINEDNSEYLKALADEIRKTITDGNSYRDLHYNEIKPLGHGEQVSVKVDTFDRVTISVRSANRTDTLTMSLRDFGERIKFPPKRSVNIQRNPEVQEAIRSFDYAYYTKQAERLSKKIKMPEKPLPLADKKINSCYAQEGKYYQAYNTNRPTRYVYSKKMYQGSPPNLWKSFGYGFAKPFRDFGYMVSHPVETAKNAYNVIANATPLEIAGCLGEQLLRSTMSPVSGLLKQTDIMKATAHDVANGTFTGAEILGNRLGDAAFDATTAAAGAGAAKVIGAVGKGAGAVGKGAGAANAKEGFGSMMEAGEAARYAKYWSNYAPKQIVPGTTRLDWLRVSSRTGRMESSRVIYDNYGRQIYRVDFSDHMRPLNHSVPHLHQYQYGPMSSFGKESVFNFLGK